MSGTRQPRQGRFLRGTYTVPEGVRVFQGSGTTPSEITLGVARAATTTTACCSSVSEPYAGQRRNWCQSMQLSYLTARHSRGLEMCWNTCVYKNLVTNFQSLARSPWCSRARPVEVLAKPTSKMTSSYFHCASFPTTTKHRANPHQ